MKRKFTSFLLVSGLFVTLAKSQTAVTAITTNTGNIATSTETNIAGAGYSFSIWLSSSTFTVNYSSAASGDILGIASLNTAAFSNLTPVVISGAIAKVQRVANAAITDTRNFITSWNRISSGPASGATSGTFNCDAPKVASMEAALLTNNLNSGYDNVFQNTTVSPHYNNIERVDYIIPTGIVATNNIAQIGAAIFDRGAGDVFKIAAITSIDASNNATAYGNPVSVAATDFTTAGLLGANFDYTIFVSDPNVSSGQHQPSTRNNQNIRGVFVSFQDMGIAINQRIYGYSLFATDVTPPTHTLTNPATFPTNTNSASILDLVNITGFFKTNVTILPLNLLSFTGHKSSPAAISLEWRTANEQNVKNYEVEKSYSGSNFIKIGEITAHNIYAEQRYEFTDASQVSGNNYYRIRMVDLDGRFNYSSILKISDEKITSDEIRTVVNPFSDKIIFQYNSVNSQPVQLQLTDVNGKVLKRIKLFMKAGSNSISIDRLQPLSKGIYFMKIVSSDNKVQMEKIVKE